MAFNVAKLVGGSKLLLLPFTGIVLGGTAISYGTYKISRLEQNRMRERERENV